MIVRVTFMILFVLFTFNLLFSSTDDIVIYNDSLKIKAEQNDPESQFLFGRCLVGGFGIKKNMELGVRYMEKASDSGYIKAKTALGAYYLGRENATDKDKKKGIALLQTALKAGDAEAGSVLGVFKVYGLADIAISQAEAIALIKNAAQQNNLKRNLSLVCCIWKGL